jgi:hypothetical protein
MLFLGYSRYAVNRSLFKFAWPTGVGRGAGMNLEWASGSGFLDNSTTVKNRYYSTARPMMRKFY